MKSRALSVGLVMLAVFVLPARAVVTFDFVFDDVSSHTGIGFDDATNGALRRSTLTSFINSTIGASLANTATVTIQVETSVTSGQFLAQAGSYTYLVPDSFQAGLVHDKIVLGDPYAGVAATMQWNFDPQYNWAINTSATAGQYDFRSVALHEMTHALGFLSWIGADGTGVLQGAPTTYSLFDSFLSNGSILLIDPATHALNASLDASALTGNVYFTGANAVAVYGGPVPVYTPASFAQGSSLSHWDEVPGLSSALMSYSIGTGEVNETWSALEIATLQDLGYTMAVPEPAAVALWMGLGVLGCMSIRRRWTAKN